MEPRDDTGPDATLAERREAMLGVVLRAQAERVRTRRRRSRQVAAAALTFATVAAALVAVRWPGRSPAAPPGPPGAVARQGSGVAPAPPGEAPAEGAAPVTPSEIAPPLLAADPVDGAERHGPRVVRLRGDRGALARARIEGGALRRALVRYVDDEELLELLAESGRPAGLIRIDGRTRLTRHVDDGPPVGMDDRSMRRVGEQSREAL